MADCYHFTREYVLWKLTYPQIFRYLDARIKKQPQDPDNTPVPDKPVAAASLKSFGFSVGK